MSLLFLKQIFYDLIKSIFFYTNFGILGSFQNIFYEYVNAKPVTQHMRHADLYPTAVDASWTFSNNFFTCFVHLPHIEFSTSTQVAIFHFVAFFYENQKFDFCLYIFSIFQAQSFSISTFGKSEIRYLFECCFKYSIETKFPTIDARLHTILSIL